METTFLHDGELNQPTGSIVLDELLADARKLTGMNFQIVSRQAFKRYGLFGMRTRRVWRVGLYVEVGGMAPWQVISCAQTSETAQAYLYGLINGCKVYARAAVPEPLTYEQFKEYLALASRPGSAVERYGARLAARLAALNPKGGQGPQASPPPAPAI